MFSPCAFYATNHAIATATITTARQPDRGGLSSLTLAYDVSKSVPSAAFIRNVSSFSSITTHYTPISLQSEPVKDLLEILTRIEKQNLAILAALTPKASRKYLSVEEAAERLDRSTWTVRQLCNSGQIRAVKGEDKTWRIPADEVARLEENGAPSLPKRTPAPFPLSSRRGKGGGSVASCSQSHAPSMSL